MSKNLMEIIARELGVELEEEFSVKGAVYTYRFTETKLEFKCNEAWIESNYLTELIYGKMEIIKIPKFPSEDSNYYFVNSEGIVIKTYFSKRFDDDVIRFKLGNYYLTKEEVEDEADRQKWIDFYNSAKRIEWE